MAPISTMACERIFANPHVMYVKNFEGVFSAIESGLCEYGIIPIENSTAGSVKQVYDLMIEHNFYIVRSTRIKVNHCLLAKPNTKKAQHSGDLFPRTGHCASALISSSPCRM